MFNWINGRQGSGYQKVRLLECRWPIRFDLWILRFPEGSYIDSHVDPVEDGYNHYRLNVIIKRSENGGVFFGEPIWRSIRVILFRPDISVHGVTKVEKGTRYVLSLGWLTRRKV